MGRILDLNRILGPANATDYECELFESSCNNKSFMDNTVKTFTFYLGHQEIDISRSGISIKQKGKGHQLSCILNGVPVEGRIHGGSGGTRDYYVQTKGLGKIKFSAH